MALRLTLHDHSIILNINTKIPGNILSENLFLLWYKKEYVGHIISILSVILLYLPCKNNLAKYLRVGFDLFDCLVMVSFLWPTWIEKYFPQRAPKKHLLPSSESISSWLYILWTKYPDLLRPSTFNCICLFYRLPSPYLFYIIRGVLGISWCRYNVPVVLIYIYAIVSV